MTLRAYIKELPSNGSNEFKVRIPYLEGNTNNEIIYTALLCNQPGEYGGYKVGDCVFVVFEDIRLDIPIILGKLYTGEEAVDSNHIVSSLTVTGSIDLPATTTIGGYSTVDIFKNYQKDTSLSNLTYEEIGEVISRLSYENSGPTWPYSGQEAYADRVLDITTVTYRSA